MADGEKEGKTEMQKFEYLKNEEFFRLNKKHFHSF